MVGRQDSRAVLAMIEPERVSDLVQERQVGVGALFGGVVVDRIEEGVAADVGRIGIVGVGGIWIGALGKTDRPRAGADLREREIGYRRVVGERALGCRFLRGVERLESRYRKVILGRRRSEAVGKGTRGPAKAGQDTIDVNVTRIENCTNCRHNDLARETRLGPFPRADRAEIRQQR